MVEILHPESLAEATALLGVDPEAWALGGGTAIQILRRQGYISPSVLVDLAGLAELRGIRAEGGWLRLGAMVTQREVELSPIVRAAAPLLAETYRQVSNVRVRHTATVGGNLAHGDYRLDPPAALLVLEAVVVVAGQRGERFIPIGEFFVDLLETALRPGEVIVEVRVPLAHPRRSGQFLKLATLGANDWPCVAVAALLEWGEDDRLAAARLGITALAAVPLLVRLDPVAGLDQSALTEMAVATALARIDPLPDLRGSAEYKRRVCRVVLGDAIAAAWGREREAARA
jgi:aerobic carbon-monoxide dehydrogenase medium subunit